MAATGNVLVIGNGPLGAGVAAGLRNAAHVVKAVSTGSGVEAAWMSSPDLIVLVGDAAADGGLRLRDELAAEPASAVIPLLVVYGGAARPAKNHTHVASVTPALGAERLARVVSLLASELAEGEPLATRALQTLTSGIQHQVERQAAFAPPGSSGARLPPPPAPVAYNSPSPRPLPPSAATAQREPSAPCGPLAPPALALTGVGLAGAAERAPVVRSSGRPPQGRPLSPAASGASAGPVSMNPAMHSAVLAELPYHGADQDADQDGPAPSLASVVELAGLPGLDGLDPPVPRAALELIDDGGPRSGPPHRRRGIGAWPARVFGIAAMVAAAVMILYGLRLQARASGGIAPRAPLGSLSHVVPR